MFIFESPLWLVNSKILKKFFLNFWINQSEKREGKFKIEKWSNFGPRYCEIGTKIGSSNIRIVIHMVKRVSERLNRKIGDGVTGPSIHKVKLKVARNEKKVLGFSFYKNIANIEACLQLKKLSTNLFFWRVCCLHLVYLHTSISTCILWPAAIITDEWLSGTWHGCYNTEWLEAILFQNQTWNLDIHVFYGKI